MKKTKATGSKTKIFKKWRKQRVARSHDGVFFSWRPRFKFCIAGVYFFMVKMLFIQKGDDPRLLDDSEWLESANVQGGFWNSKCINFEVFREALHFQDSIHRKETQFRTPPPCKTLVERLGKNPRTFWTFCHRAWVKQWIWQIWIDMTDMMIQNTKTLSFSHWEWWNHNWAGRFVKTHDSSHLMHTKR